MNTQQAASRNATGPAQDQAGQDHAGQDTSAQVVLHEQRLRVDLQRVPTERVVLRRRIVTTVRQVEVTPRREELEVTRLPLPGAQPGSAAPAPSRPLVIVLSEEVPVVQIATQPYEQVRVHIDTIPGQQQVAGTVGHEQAEVTTNPTLSAP